MNVARQARIRYTGVRIPRGGTSPFARYTSETNAATKSAGAEKNGEWLVGSDL